MTDEDRRDFFEGTAVALAGVGVAGCTGDGSGGSGSESGGSTSSSGSGPNVRMGYGGSLTGKWDFNEDSMGPLLKMTIEHINEQGGSNPH
jgi:hypothetical protein